MKAGAGASGVPLPTVFAPLAQAGIHIRRGQVTMIAAAPNGCKSFLAQYLSTRLTERDGITGLYFSADTDDATMKKRAASILTGDNVDDIERSYLRGKGGEYDQELERLHDMRYDFDSDPSFNHMGEEILAFCEAWGDYPEIVIVDNLMNVITETNDEWVGLKNVTKGLHRVTRQTGSAVIVLHHVNEGHNDPNYPAARKSIAGKVAQLPEQILTLGFDSYAGILRVACVKNRGAKHDPSGKTYVELYTDVAHGAIYESRWAKNENRVA